MIILVLLPKLTNPPTKVHAGYLANWGSGLISTYLLCGMHIFLLLVVLYCTDHYASSSTLTPLHTYISWKCLHISFLLELKNMWNRWKNHFSEVKGDVGMSPYEKEGEQEDTYTKTETHL